jgi:hypothetical protein
MARQVQGLALGAQRQSGTATPSISGELQVNALLLDPVFRASQEGLVTDLRIGGQPVLCSNLGMGIRCFDFSAQVEGRRALGIPAKRKTTWQASFTLAAAGSVFGAIGVDPIDEAETLEFDDPRMAPRLCYGFGLGSTAIGAGADVEISAVCRKGGELGPMVLYTRAAGGMDEVSVFDIQVNGISLLAGRGGATVGANVDEIGLAFFDFQRTDLDGRTLNYDIGQNDVLTIKLHNYGVGAHTVDGGIFMLPR